MNKTMTARPIWLVMAVFSFMIAMFVGTGAQASVIDSGAFVDKITSSQSEYQPREIGEIGMEFSEKPGHKFKPGDEMVLPLPAEFKGFPNTMMLEDYAQVFVEGNQVRVVFTDKVTKKNHVKGKLKFSIKAGENIERGTSKQVSLDFGTKANPFPVVTVKGYPVANEGDGKDRPAADFAYKGGNVNENDSEVIDWYIVVNADRLKVAADTVLRDTLGKGHQFVDGSVKVNGHVLTAQEGKLVMNGESFEMTLKASAVSGQTIGVNYQTRLTEAGKKMKTVSNDFKADFQVENGVPSSISGGSSVKNVLMSGEIEGDEEQIHEGKEETVEEMAVEEVTDVVEFEELDEHAIDCVEEDHAHERVEIKKNEVNGHVAEEVVGEDEKLGTLDDINFENGNVIEEENGSNQSVEVNEVEVHVAPAEEEVTEEVVEEIIPEEVEKIEEEVVVPEKENNKNEEVAPEKEDDKNEEVAPEKEDNKNENVTSEVEIKNVEKVAVKQAAKKSAVETKQVVETKAEELPQTGSSNNKLVAVLGVVLMVLAAFMIRPRSGK